jgi:hypothetical protein
VPVVVTDAPGALSALQRKVLPLCVRRALDTSTMKVEVPAFLGVVKVPENFPDFFVRTVPKYPVAYGKLSLAGNGVTSRRARQKDFD